MKTADCIQNVYCILGDNPSLKDLKRLRKVLKQMIEEYTEVYEEMDAEYEMGRGAMPPGYYERLGR